MGSLEKFTFTQYTLTQIIDSCMADATFADHLLSGNRELQVPALVQYVPEDKVEDALVALDPILPHKELIREFLMKTDPEASVEMIAV